MPDVSARVARWLDVVIDLLAEPHFVMPGAAIVQHLRQVFDVTVVSWNSQDSPTDFGLELDPPEMRRAEPEMWKVWETGALNDCHALMAWHTTTNDLTAQTPAGVPTLIMPKRRRLIVERPLARLDSEQQLTLNYRLEGYRPRAFVLRRSRRDFSDEDLQVAHLVQRTQVSLDRQVQALELLVEPPAAQAATDLRSHRPGVVRAAPCRRRSPHRPGGPDPELLPAHRWQAPGAGVPQAGRQRSAERDPCRRLAGILPAVPTSPWGRQDLRDAPSDPLRHESTGA